MRAERNARPLCVSPFAGGGERTIAEGDGDRGLANPSTRRSVRAWHAPLPPGRLFGSQRYLPPAFGEGTKLRAFYRIRERR
jgi:hypothetical protein